jgi:uncharacterized membrane protein
MFRISSVIGLVSLAAMGLVAQPALAQTPNDVLASFKTAAAGDAKFQGFSAARGEQFFKAKHGKEWSCTSCHSDNPAAQGKHANSGKDIQPLAPAANAERFTDMAKVEKWFKRNCNDVLGRVCTPLEKGDVLSYLLTVKK